MDRQFGSTDEVLDFAIKNEQEAYELYTSLAGKVEHAAMQEVFKQFAHEELGHKAKLQNIKAGGELKPAEGKIQNLKIADYLVDIEPGPNMTYQEALIIAMQAEKRAFMLYSDLANQTDDAMLKKLFLGLAQEEAKHKLRFEIEYDDNIMTDN